MFATLMACGGSEQPGKDTKAGAPSAGRSTGGSAGHKPEGGRGGRGGGGGGEPDIDSYPDVLKVAFSPMYSAYDGGMHDYKLPACLKSSDFDPNGVDPVSPDSVQWHVDLKFLASAKYPGLPGGVMLTTKASGKTLITATAKTRGGMMVRGTAMLIITKADPDLWAMGEARYNNNVPIDYAKLMTMGVSVNVTSLIPRESSCGNCHNESAGLSVEHSPQQTAGYSDEDLINIFSKAATAMDPMFHSPFLKMLPMQQATAVYTQLHSWDISSDAAQGVVYKLRSIPPSPQPNIDVVRLK